MSWTLNELLFELDQDQKRRILFVEGARDMAFWREIVPSMERGDTVVYAISEVECEKVLGGERGRLMWCAINVQPITRMNERLLFFADADYDLILGNEIPTNVVLTDGRDLESYALTPKAFRRLAMRGLAGSQEYAETLLSWVISVTRPIGLLRIASARNSLDLPFAHSFLRGISRFLVGAKLAAVLEVDGLLRALLQNAKISLSRITEIKRQLESEIDRQLAVTDSRVVHGKDLVRSLSWLFGSTEGQTEAMLFLCVDTEEICRQPNFFKARKWVLNESDEAMAPICEP